MPLNASAPVSRTVAGVVYQPDGWSVPLAVAVVRGAVASRSKRPARVNGPGLLPHGSVPAYDQL